LPGLKVEFRTHGDACLYFTAKPITGWGAV
jgi:hypothetical protein